MTQQKLVLELDNSLISMEIRKMELEATEVFLFDMVEEAEEREHNNMKHVPIDYFTRRLRGSHSLLTKVIKELENELSSAQEIVRCLHAENKKAQG